MQHMPKYSYLHINLGILKDAMGAPGDEVETYFTNALNYDRRNPSAYLYYGRWLSSQGRSHEALPLLERGRSLSPGHRELNETLRAVREESRRAASAEVAALRERVATDPSPESWVEVSLAYYHADMLVESVAACDSALALRPDYALAYNNKCSAYCRMGEWEKASAACEKALAITPNFEQARNNLKWARSGMAVPGQE